MPAVAIHCPICSGAIQIDTSLAGQQVACPLCQGLLAIPDESVLLGGSYEQHSYEQEYYGQPGEAPPHDPYAGSAGDAMQLACPICGGGFQVSPEMAGQQVGCPHCHQPVQLPPLQSEYGDAPAAMDTGPQDAASLLPPGMEAHAPLPAPTSQPAPQPASGMPADPRLPPSRKDAPTEGKSSKKPEQDRFPPGFAGKSAKPKVDERDRSPPTRPAERTTSPAESKAAVSPSDEQQRRERRERRKQEKQHAVDDLLPPGAEPEAALVPATTSPTTAKSKSPKPTTVPTQEAEPAVESLLPPGAAEPTAATSAVPSPSPATAAPTTKKPADNGVDQLLPPGDASQTPASSAPAPKKPLDVVDTMLPHGDQESARTGTTGQQVAIPKAPIRLPKAPTDLSPGAVAVPTPEGGFVTVKESATKTITSGNQEIEVRKLSAEEKAKRRRRNNFILGGFCLIILVVVMLILMNM